MPAPHTVLGTPGNLINNVTVPKGATIAAFLDASAWIEARLTCEMTPGTTPPTAGTVFTAFQVYGNSSQNTLGAAAAAAATSLTVASSAGLRPGMKIALQQAGSPSNGEIVTVASTYTAGSTTVPVSATLYGYSTGDKVYLVEQTGTVTVMPANASGTWTANTDESKTIDLGTAQWIVAANNTDASQSVNVTVSLDYTDKYQ